MRLPPDRAFSLLELLLVLALIGVLAAGMLSYFSSVSQATALTTGAERLQEILNEAQQAALTHNVTVEVLFYQTASSASLSPAYQIVQARQINSDGSLTAVMAPASLPSGVVIDPTAAHSPLLASNTEAPTPDAADPLLNTQTRVFHFLPDGSTDLAPSTSWFLTLRAATASSTGPFPANWACLTLDPATGRVQIFRP